MASQIATLKDLQDFKINGKSVPLTMIYYDDGGVSVRLATGSQREVAKVGGNNSWSITNLDAFYNNARQVTKDNSFSKEKLQEAIYTQALTNSGSGGYWNKRRAEVFNKSTNLSPNQRDAFASNGVPGLIVTSGTNAGKISQVGGKFIDQPATAAPSSNDDGDKPQDSSDLNAETSETGLTQTGEPLESAVASIDPKEKSLRYPLSIPPGIPYDFIRISAYKYVAGGLQFGPTRTSIEERFKDLVTTVTLPMQPNLSESNSVDWGGDNLDPIRAALAGLSIGAMSAMEKTELEPLKKAAEEGGNRLSEILKDPNSSGAIKAYFAGQAVGSNISARATGAVINPNMELLFSGPRMRTFNFDFRLTPRSNTEAAMIKKIIRSFKMNSAVQRSKSHAFLLTPNIFKLEYIYNGSGQHPFLNKFKPCALTNFSVNYTPDGSYMTYRDGGSLTSYNISMSFSELEPIYQDDYAKDYNSHTSMGY